MTDSSEPPTSDAAAPQAAPVADTTGTVGQHVEIDYGDDNDSALGDDKWVDYMVISYQIED